MLDPDWDPGTDAWFSGFIDGEGCFGIYWGGGNAKEGLVPRFTLALRGDELELLEALHRRFGGRLKFGGSRPTGYGNAYIAAPRCELIIVAKRPLAELVRYFDAFPLRAKKARDYALWRRAVQIYCQHGARAARSELLALRNTLMGLRAFDPSLASGDLEHAARTVDEIASDAQLSIDDFG